MVAQATRLESLPLTAKGRLRVWFDRVWEEYQDREESITSQELTEAAAASFLKDRQWVQAIIMPMLANEIRRLIAQKRDRGQVLLPTVGDDTLTIEEYNERLEQLKLKWGAWAERIPSLGYTWIRKLTRPQLLRIAAQRAKQSRAEARTAYFLRQLAKQLPDDHTSVEEVLQDKEIEQIATASNLHMRGVKLNGEQHREEAMRIIEAQDE